MGTSPLCARSRRIATENLSQKVATSVDDTDAAVQVVVVSQLAETLILQSFSGDLHATP